MKEGSEEESAVGYTAPQTAFTQNVYIFSQLHAVVFEQSSFSSGILLIQGNDNTKRESETLCCVPDSTYLLLPAKLERPSDIRVLRFFVCLFVSLCKTPLGYFPISAAVPGPSAEVISCDPSQLSHLALYNTFQYISDVFNVCLILQHKHTLNFMILINLTN